MNKKGTDPYVLLILLATGLLFLKSGFEKVTEGAFVGGLAKTLGFFASKNPNPSVKGFLVNTAIPNAEFFGVLTMWGEVLAGASICIAVGYFLMKRTMHDSMLLLLGIGLFVAALLNFVFWLAAGWASASTDSLNLLMFVVEVIGLVFVAKHYTIDK